LNLYGIITSSSLPVKTLFQFNKFNLLNFSKTVF
jgi:hypothetical protein